MLIFSDYYYVKENWLDDETLDPIAILANMYGQYFTADGKPNYAELREGIINNNKSATELFKSLFRIKHALNPASPSLVSSDIIQKIEQTYGNKIVAHGVEEMKGGMYNLLMMSVANRVRASKESWGFFRNGIPNLSPINHGPYYIIYTTDVSKNNVAPHYPQLNDIKNILVPFMENIMILTNHSKLLLENGLIDEKQHAMFCSKLVSYDQFSLNLANEINADKENSKPDPLVVSDLTEKSNFSLNDLTNEINAISSNESSKPANLGFATDEKASSTINPVTQSKTQKVARSLNNLFGNKTQKTNSENSSADEPQPPRKPSK